MKNATMCCIRNAILLWFKCSEVLLSPRSFGGWLYSLVGMYYYYNGCYLPSTLEAHLSHQLVLHSWCTFQHMHYFRSCHRLH